MAATAVIDFLFRGHAAQFQRFADELMDGFLDLVHFLLGIEKVARHRIAQHCVTMLLEIRNFLTGQLHGKLLLLLERLAFCDDAVILRPGGLVAHKRLNTLADYLNRRLLQNGLAEFLGLPEDGSFFNSRVHFRFALSCPVGPWTRRRVNASIHHIFFPKATAQNRRKNVRHREAAPLREENGL